MGGRAGEGERVRVYEEGGWGGWGGGAERDVGG